jgi:argininosuccinate lyase
MQVGKEIESGAYQPSNQVHHTHEGSIGNLCNDQLTAQMHKIWQEFRFEHSAKAIHQLLL